MRRGPPLVWDNANLLTAYIRAPPDRVSVPSLIAVDISDIRNGTETRCTLPSTHVLMVFRLKVPPSSLDPITPYVRYYCP